MAEISAAMVMKLRKMSGQGMMDCKRALQDTNGDVEQAMDLLRKKGLATLAKRASRDTSEGLIVSKISPDGKMAALATLCCETDFVAKSDDFVATAQILADVGLACPADEGIENVLETSADSRKFSDFMTELVSKTGEKTQVGDYAKYKLDGPGLISTYIHFNEKVGTMVQFDTSNDATAAGDAIKQAASDIAMHITATKPLALDKDQIDPETIEREKAIFAEQVKNKPANIIDKIIEGKMKKFYTENCLLQQPFVKDDSKSVEEVLTEAAKQAGGEAKIKRFVRFEVGIRDRTSSVDRPCSSGASIVNVWAVVDNRTLSWLQSKSREECFAFAIQVAQVIADDIYSSIEEWMQREKCYISIVTADPFTKDNAVQAVIQSCRTGDPTWQKMFRECQSFLSRTGHTEFGGEVAIVIGCR